jgi:hypothetical protein
VNPTRQLLEHNPASKLCQRNWSDPPLTEEVSSIRMIPCHEIKIRGHIRRGGEGAPVSQKTSDSGRERRDRSPEGLSRRARFEASLKLLADLGLSPNAVEYYRQLARKKRTLPHVLVRQMAEKVAAPESVVLGRMGLSPSHPV